MNVEKKNILLIFNAEAIGLRYQLIQSLLLKNYSITIAIDIKEEKALHYVKKLEDNVKFIEFSFNRVSRSPLDNISCYKKMKFLLQSENPDILFLSNVKPVIYGSLAGHSLGIKNVFSLIPGLGYAFGIQKSILQLVTKLSLRFLYKLSFKRNKAVFLQNLDDIDYLTKTNIISKNKCVKVNGSGVDLDFFVKTKLPKAMTFFMATRLIAEKGIWEYIEAAKIIKKKHPHVVFKLAGNIDKNPNSITEQDLSHVKKHVEFVGYCKNMKTALQECSVLVYPTYYKEGIPRAILEALATGRPVITTDWGGCRETVNNGVNGFLIPIKNHKALAQAMLQLIKDNQLMHTMGEKSHQLAKKLFDVNKVNQTIINAIESQFAN